MIRIAFCNDCDRMVWEDFLKIHELFDELSLPAGDSFWLFDPLGISDMSLFRNDVGTKADNHDRLLEQIKAGRVDVLHGVGLFGKTDDDYVYPDRDEIRRAFDYLAANDCNVRAYVSHGNTKHRHNLPARADTRRYQAGDLPYSGFYILDIARDYGIDYFWMSEIYENLDRPFRLLREATMPSGETIWAFSRYGQWGTGTHTIPSVLNEEVLGRALAMRQNLVLFTHWGMKGVYTETPDLDLLHPGVVRAFALLARLQAEGKVEVVRLPELLDRERGVSLAGEADRVSGLLPPGQEACPSEMYAGLAAEIGLMGGLALDATGTGGDFAVHLAGRFKSVVYLDADEQALARAQYLASCLVLPEMSLFQGGVEKAPLAGNSVHAVFLRASAVDRGALARIYDMLVPGHILCVFLDSPTHTAAALQRACAEMGFKSFETLGPADGASTGKGAFLGGYPRFFASK